MLCRFLWVQFEGYLPDNQRSYRYPVTQTVELSGYPFIYDTFTFDIDRAVAQRPDSDLAAAQRFLHDAGYRLTGEVYAQQFVHLIGTDQRNELMIIYGERSEEAETGRTLDFQARVLASFTVEFTTRKHIECA